VDVCDQMRESFITTLCEMHLVADPIHRALDREAGLHLVGGFDALSGFRHLFWVEDPYPSSDFLVVLLPDLAQYLDLSKIFEVLWRVRSNESPKKPKAIGTHRL
jgi:hypothetical protein